MLMPAIIWVWVVSCTVGVVVNAQSTSTVGVGTQPRPSNTNAADSARTARWPDLGSLAGAQRAKDLLVEVGALLVLECQLAHHNAPVVWETPDQLSSTNSVVIKRMITTSLNISTLKIRAVAYWHTGRYTCKSGHGIMFERQSFIVSVVHDSTIGVDLLLMYMSLITAVWSLSVASLVASAVWNRMLAQKVKQNVISSSLPRTRNCSSDEIERQSSMISGVAGFCSSCYPLASTHSNHSVGTPPFKTDNGSLGSIHMTTSYTSHQGLLQQQSETGTIQQRFAESLTDIGTLKAYNFRNLDMSDHIESSGRKHCVRQRDIEHSDSLWSSTTSITPGEVFYNQDYKSTLTTRLGTWRGGSRHKDRPSFQHVKTGTGEDNKHTSPQTSVVTRSQSHDVCPTQVSCDHLQHADKPPGRSIFLEGQYNALAGRNLRPTVSDLNLESASLNYPRPGLAFSSRRELPAVPGSPHSNRADYSDDYEHTSHQSPQMLSRLDSIGSGVLCTPLSACRDDLEFPSSPGYLRPIGSSESSRPEELYASPKTRDSRGPSPRALGGDANSGMVEEYAMPGAGNSQGGGQQDDVYNIYHKGGVQEQPHLPQPVPSTQDYHPRPDPLAALTARGRCPKKRNVHFARGSMMIASPPSPLSRLRACRSFHDSPLSGKKEAALNNGKV